LWEARSASHNKLSGFYAFSTIAGVATQRQM
jgi:hypothetical protein